MRAIFGIVSLLVVLAALGVLATKQLRGTTKAVGESLPPAQSSTENPVEAPAASSVRAQSLQLQQRVGSEVGQALQQGAQRNQDAEK